MAIVASDIVVYGSASMPDDDTPTAIGGAIDQDVLIAFTDLSADDTIEIVSSAAGDTTQTVTVYGRNAAGEIVSEAIGPLTGTTFVGGATTFERILKIVMSATAVGNVTIRDASADVAIAVIPIGALEIRRPFYNAAAESGSGSARAYYEKVFISNDHATLTLTEAVLSLTDGSGLISFAMETTLDNSDNNGGGNRQTHAGGYTFDATPKNVVNSQNLTALSAQGVWLKLTLAAGEAAANTSFTLTTTGQTV